MNAQKTFENEHKTCNFYEPLEESSSLKVCDESVKAASFEVAGVQPAS